MGKWKFLTIGFDWDPPRADNIVCWDDQSAGTEIASHLPNPENLHLCEYLRQAARENWQLANSEEVKLVLKRYTSG